MLEPKMLAEKLSYCAQHFSCVGCPGPKCQTSSTLPRGEYIMKHAALTISAMHERLRSVIPAMAEFRVDGAMQLRVPPDVLLNEVKSRLLQETAELIMKHPEAYKIKESFEAKTGERRYRMTVLIMPQEGGRDA